MATARKTTNTRKRKKEINRNEMVTCRNVTSGMLVYVSVKTGLTTIWQNYGDEEYMDVGELLTMKSSQPRFLSDPWIIIEDEDVVEYLGLKNMYENILPVDQLDSLFSKPVEEIKELVTKAPQGTKDLIADKATQLVKEEKLYDNRIIRLLEKELNIDLSIVQ